jgi:hypothetical protein
VGCDLHSADEIRPELQALQVGDRILLAPAEGAPWCEVAQIEAPTTLVLLGGDAGGPRTTWQWVLRPLGGGRRTRLLVCQRLERRMLRGLARRAEGRELIRGAGRPR